MTEPGPVLMGKRQSDAEKFRGWEDASTQLLFVRESVHDCGHFCAILGSVTGPRQTVGPARNRTHGAVAYPYQPNLS